VCMVHWPGSPRPMCVRCARRARDIAAAMDFSLSITLGCDLI
jgi:hypothetical protein